RTAARTQGERVRRGNPGSSDRLVARQNQGRHGQRTPLHLLRLPPDVVRAGRDEGPRARRRPELRADAAWPAANTLARVPILGISRLWRPAGGATGRLDGPSSEPALLPHT